LLSIARSNSSISQTAPLNEFSQICFGFRARFAPTVLPAFHSGRLVAGASVSGISMIILHGQNGRLKNALALDSQVLLGASTHQPSPFVGRRRGHPVTTKATAHWQLNAKPMKVCLHSRTIEAISAGAG
jgi:hypothetical protein